MERRLTAKLVIGEAMKKFFKIEKETAFIAYLDGDELVIEQCDTLMLQSVSDIADEQYDEGFEDGYEEGFEESSKAHYSNGYERGFYDAQSGNVYNDKCFPDGDEGICPDECEPLFCTGCECYCEKTNTCSIDTEGENE